MKYLIINNLRYYFPRIIILFIYLYLLYFVFHLSFYHVQIGGNNIYNHLYPFERKTEWWFYVLVYIIIISVLSVFVLLLLSFYFNYKSNRSGAIKRKYELIFSEKIIEYIYSDRLKESGLIEEPGSFLKKKLRNKLVIVTFFSVIIRIQEMIDEDLSDKFKLLFGQLRLDEKIRWFLQSRKLSEKIIALQIISCLKIKGYRQIIVKYAGSRNYILRTVALSTLIRLSKTDHLNVMLEHEHYISQMDINVIINEVEKNRKADIEYISLIRSKSPRVIAIGLLLIQTRNKAEYKEMIKPLLEINDPFLHNVALEVFTFFAGTDEDLKFMIERFDNETFNNKKLILRSLVSFQQNKEIFDFVGRVIRNESILLKIEALRILFENNVEHFLSYKDSDDRNIAAAYNELVDLNLG
jgi:hypothetical protein